MERRRFIAAVVGVALTPFATFVNTFRRREPSPQGETRLLFRDDIGDWIEIEPLEPFFDIVEHPTLKDSKGGPMLVTRYNGKGATFHG